VLNNLLPNLPLDASCVYTWHSCIIIRFASNTFLLDISCFLPLVPYIFYIYRLYIQSMPMYNMLGALGQLLAYLHF
jgi:hypothetical protein